MRFTLERNTLVRACEQLLTMSNADIDQHIIIVNPGKPVYSQMPRAVGNRASLTLGRTPEYSLLFNGSALQEVYKGLWIKPDAP
jgi:hypothetical protein